MHLIRDELDRCIRVNGSVSPLDMVWISLVLTEEKFLLLRADLGDDGVGMLSCAGGCLQLTNQRLRNWKVASSDILSEFEPGDLRLVVATKITADLALSLVKRDFAECN